MTNPFNDVQKALVDWLRGTSPARLSCPIYDAVPQNTAYPYVTFDASESVPSEPLAKRRDLRFEYLSVWSTYRGQKEVKRILAELDAALHNKRLPMDSGKMVLCRVERMSTGREPDNVTYMGSLTLRLMTEH